MLVVNVLRPSLLSANDEQDAILLKKGAEAFHAQDYGNALAIWGPLAEKGNAMRKDTFGFCIVMA